MIVSIEEKEIISGYFNDYTLGNHIDGNCIRMYFDFKDRGKVDLIIKDLRNLFEIKEIKWSSIDRENWMKNWMKNFTPVNISDRVMITPDWDSNKYESMHTVKICPAMAFGTGHHASTQLIIEHMIKYNVGYFNSLLDLGCGSGILSFLAKKMGINNVKAIDIDPICKDNFYKNLELNKIDDIDFSIQDVHAFKDYNFDVILANIDKKNIIKIINKYEQYNSKAILIIAGLLNTDKKDILECIKTASVDSILGKDEWISMVIKR